MEHPTCLYYVKHKDVQNLSVVPVYGVKDTRYNGSDSGFSFFLIFDVNRQRFTWVESNMYLPASDISL